MTGVKIARDTLNPGKWTGISHANMKITTPMVVRRTRESTVIKRCVQTSTADHSQAAWIGIHMGKKFILTSPTIGQRDSTRRSSTTTRRGSDHAELLTHRRSREEAPVTTTTTTRKLTHPTTLIMKKKHTAETMINIIVTEGMKTIICPGLAPGTKKNVRIAGERAPDTHRAAEAIAEGAVSSMVSGSVT